MLDIKVGKSYELILKCLKVFHKKRGKMKFKKICFLLNESPSKLLNNKTFRELIIEGVLIPSKGVSNPDQEYEYDWWKLRKLFMDSNFFNDTLDACKIKAVIK